MGRSRPPGQDITDAPHIDWGLIKATINGLKVNIEHKRIYEQVNGVFIGYQRPQKEAYYPALIVELHDADTHPGGLYGSDEGIGRDKNFIMVTEGQLGIEIIARSPEEMWTLRDFLRTRHFARELFDDSWSTNAANQDYVAIGYNPGQLSFTRPTEQVPPYASQESADQWYYSTCTFEFYAEHYVPYELAQLSAINLEITRPTRDEYGQFYFGSDGEVTNVQI